MASGFWADFAADWADGDAVEIRERIELLSALTRRLIGVSGLVDTPGLFFVATPRKAIMGKVYVGDVPEIVVDCRVALTGATLKQLVVQKPDKTEVEWSAEIYQDTKLRYLAQEDDLDLPGTYKIQPKVTLGNWTGRGLTVYLYVAVPFT